MYNHMMRRIRRTGEEEEEGTIKKNKGSGNAFSFSRW
jgi:hypothetical protein